jgi:hypothetical protein
MTSYSLENLSYMQNTNKLNIQIHHEYRLCLTFTLLILILIFNADYPQPLEDAIAVPQ